MLTFNFPLASACVARSVGLKGGGGCKLTLMNGGRSDDDDGSERHGPTYTRLLLWLLQVKEESDNYLLRNTIRVAFM